MSDDNSDDEFNIDGSFGLPVGKGKAKAAAPAKSAPSSFLIGLDKLVDESRLDVERSEKVSAIMDLGDDILDEDPERFEEQIARTDAFEAQDRAEHKAIMEDTSIRVPGTIQVFRRPRGRASPPPGLRLSPPSLSAELTVLCEAAKRAETDPADLEELLRGGLVPWLKQKKSKGLVEKVPVEVFRWLLRLVARHEVCAVVLAAEEALLCLLAEDDEEWRLRYEDIVDIWRACGAVWIDKNPEGSDSANTSRDAMGDEGQTDDDDDDDDEEDEMGCLRRNLGPALNVVEACLRRGAHEMTPAELRDVMLDLAAACLDHEVNASCQTEAGRAIEAVVDAMPAKQYEDQNEFSSLVSGLCDPSARALKSRMTPPSWALLARNIPNKRRAPPSSSPAPPAPSSDVAFATTAPSAAAAGATAAPAATTVVRSLSHEVCHRLLMDRFLSQTSYADAETDKEIQGVSQSSSGGLKRALRALQVLLDDEDDLLENEGQDAYTRQYVVIALANEMAAGSLAASPTGKPDPEESKRMVRLLDNINKELVNTFQPSVQMSKTLLHLMKSKYTPFLPSSSGGRQVKLAFGNAPGGGGGGDSDNDGEKEGGSQ